jgi:hypothetical protein
MRVPNPNGVPATDTGAPSSINPLFFNALCRIKVTPRSPSDDLDDRGRIPKSHSIEGKNQQKSLSRLQENVYSLPEAKRPKAPTLSQPSQEGAPRGITLLYAAARKAQSRHNLCH